MAKKKKRNQKGKITFFQKGKTNFFFNFFSKATIEKEISRRDSIGSFQCLKKVMIFQKITNQQLQPLTIQSVKKFAVGVRNSHKNTFNFLVTIGKRFSVTLELEITPPTSVESE